MAKAFDSASHPRSHPRLLLKLEALACMELAIGDLLMWLSKYDPATRTLTIQILGCPVGHKKWRQVTTGEEDRRNRTLRKPPVDDRSSPVKDY